MLKLNSMCERFYADAEIHDEDDFVIYVTINMSSRNELFILKSSIFVIWGKLP